MVRRQPNPSHRPPLVPVLRRALRPGVHRRTGSCRDRRETDPTRRGAEGVAIRRHRLDVLRLRERENERLRREKRAVIEQREEHGELVKYVEEERGAATDGVRAPERAALEAIEVVRFGHE